MPCGAGTSLSPATVAAVNRCYLAIDVGSDKLAAAIVGEDAAVGRMTDERWKTFFDAAAGQGVYPKNLDYKAAYRLDVLPK